jgi:hypothetical protein
VIVSGAAAAKLIAALERSDEAEQQLVLAKVTGNYKRGNERLARQHSRNRGR